MQRVEGHGKGFRFYLREVESDRRNDMTFKVSFLLSGAKGGVDHRIQVRDGEGLDRGAAAEPGKSEHILGGFWKGSCQGFADGLDVERET